MRFLLLIFIVLAQPALAADEWRRYHDTGSGAVADIPPGFEPAGPTMHGGQLFRDSTGATLSVYGVPMLEKGFTAMVLQDIAEDQAIYSFPISGQTITLDWAEYWGGSVDRALRVRMKLACHGQALIVARFLFAEPLSAIADRVTSSLAEGESNTC